MEEITGPKGIVACLSEDFKLIQDRLIQLQDFERRFRAIATESPADAVTSQAAEKDWAKEHLESRRSRTPRPVRKIDLGSLSNHNRPGEAPGAQRARDPAEIGHGLRGSQDAERSAERNVSRSLQHRVACRTETEKRRPVRSGDTASSSMDEATLKANASNSK